jgi:broad specificity phosphatase PhoE
MSDPVAADAQILLLRHGAFERVHDEAGRRAERLLPAAEAAADALAARLATSGRTLVLYSGPQARAVLTAERLAQRLRQPVYADADLDELRLGRDPDLDGTATAALWEQARRQPGLPALPGAETATAVGERGASALVGAVRANPGRLVVAVSHGALVAATLVALGLEPAPREIDYGEGFWLGGDPLACIGTLAEV